MKQIIHKPSHLNFTDDVKEKLASSANKIREDIQSNPDYDCISSIFHDEFDLPIASMQKQLDPFDTIVVIGTGGSCLGARALYAITKDPQKTFYFLESFDSERIISVLSKVDFQKTGFLIVSKSGNTAETYIIAKSCIQTARSKKLPLKDHFFVITEKHDSNIFNLAQDNELTIWEHPQTVGGRFSFFTMVTMLPSALMGWDIKEIYAGARQFLTEFIKNDQYENEYLAAAFIGYTEKHMNEWVWMPYQKKWSKFVDWYRQLVAESTGKDGQGITPIYALGSVDQHSQCQLFLDGPRNKLFSFLFHMIDEDTFIYDGKSFTELQKIQYDSTIQALIERGHFVREFVFEANHLAFQIGAFVMQNMLEVILFCHMIKVNPFNQPSVEDIKKHVRQFI